MTLIGYVRYNEDLAKNITVYDRYCKEAIKRNIPTPHDYVYDIAYIDGYNDQGPPLEEP